MTSPERVQWRKKWTICQYPLLTLAISEAIFAKESPKFFSNILQHMNVIKKNSFISYKFWTLWMWSITYLRLLHEITNALTNHTISVHTNHVNHPVKIVSFSRQESHTSSQVILEQMYLARLPIYVIGKTGLILPYSLIRCSKTMLFTVWIYKASLEGLLQFAAVDEWTGIYREGTCGKEGFGLEK